MGGPRITSIVIYPVKGMHGVDLKEADVVSTGLSADRRFMVVDAAGRFVSQREVPRLARVRPHLSPDGLTFAQNGAPVSTVRRSQWEAGKRVCVRVWDDTVEAIDQGEEIGRLLSDALDRPVRLVYMPDSTSRLVRTQAPSMGPVTTSFSDAYPILLASQESLQELNSSLDSPMPMTRFRPNLVVTGCRQPYDEDRWRHFRIANVEFRGAVRRARCVVTTVDQESGEQKGREPLATLVRLRRFENGACFGIGVNHYGRGNLRIADAVEVLEHDELS